MTMVVSSPHRTKGDRVAKLMRLVIFCTAPGMATLMSFFGWGVMFQVWLGIGTAVAVEALCLSARGRIPSRELRDFSAALTGLLLGLAIPPYAPWWVVISGTSFAMLFAKHLYGGLGMNPFNPAMAGYVFLLITFPVEMTSWTPPLFLSQYAPGLLDSIAVIFVGETFDGRSLAELRIGIDGFAMATPLDHLKLDLNQGLMISEVADHPVYGAFAGAGWEWVNIAFLLGGLILVQQKAITWAIPGGVLTGLFGSSLLFTIWNPDAYASPIFHLFSGSTMLAAFFIATDPVSASTTPRGRWYYGLGIGVITYFIRTFGGYPDAFAFAVLLMNIAAPTIDLYTPPTVYGHKRES